MGQVWAKIKPDADRVRGGAQGLLQDPPGRHRGRPAHPVPDGRDGPDELQPEGQVRGQPQQHQHLRGGVYDLACLQDAIRGAGQTRRPGARLRHRQLLVRGQARG